jgi:sterol desaturase/sphingolipid hydroxylase (fatty acid hydroxylase superfamily)
MLWDHLFGTFRPYLADDRINPKAQLDEKTGKSWSYLEQLQNRQEWEKFD